MQVLDDIWSSVKGNAKTRVKDPIIGTFIVTWVFCNWDKLVILLWGSGKVEERVSELASNMALVNNPDIIFSDLDLIIIPMTLTLIYLFGLPAISLWVKKKQYKMVLSQHSHSVGLDIKLAEEQKALNKVVLRGNQEKDFLAEEIKLEQQKEKERVERRNKIREYIDTKLEASKAEAEIKSAAAEKGRLEVDSKKRKDEIEKRRFDEKTIIHKATMASSRFPAVYQMMESLTESLQKDNILISLNGLANCVAAVFGYVNSKEMMDDESFNNEKLLKVEYIYHDPSFLTKRLEEIVECENSDNEDLSEEMLYDHITGMFEDYSFSFLSDESLAETINESINENSYDILNSEALSGPLAESDTLYEEIELELDSYNFNEDGGFEVKMSGYASGDHRKDSDIPGRDLSISIIAFCSSVVGKYGLLPYELKISGSLRDY